MAQAPQEDSFLSYMQSVTLSFSLSHQEVGVVALHPRLLVQVRYVELAARRVRRGLVVLLKDLVEAHVVQVDVPAELAGLDTGLTGVSR